MLFLQFILYSSSFVGTLVNEIPGAALEPCQLKIKQFSPYILKFSTKHKDYPFTLKYSMVSRTVWFIFHADLRRPGSNSFQHSSYKEKKVASAHVSRLSSPFLMTMVTSIFPCSGNTISFSGIRKIALSNYFYQVLETYFPLVEAHILI